jgi:hypothetical protein
MSLSYSHLVCLQNPSSSHYSATASDSEMNDDNYGRHHIKLSPRMSMSAAEDDPPSGPSTPKRKFSKFNIGESRFYSRKCLLFS